MLLPQWADYPRQTDIWLPCLWWVWWGGWEGLGLDMVQRYRPRGVWSIRWQRAAHRSGNLDAPVGIWAQAQSLVPGIGLSRGGRVRDLGYRPGQPGRWRGSSAARVACSAGPGLKSRAKLWAPGQSAGASTSVPLSPLSAVLPLPLYVPVTCVWSTCCLSTLK